MTQEEQIIQRDFYSEIKVTFPDILKFTGVSLLSQAAAYYYVFFLTSYTAILLRGTASDVFWQVILTVPAAYLLPFFLVRRYLSRILPKLYTLADDPERWYEKAIRLTGAGEVLRFFLGLLPFSYTAYGLLTSPVTYLLYTLLYVNPADGYEKIIVDHQPGAADTAVFMLIYCLYFAVFEFSLFRECRKAALRRRRNLENDLIERNKESSFYRKGV